ncbi:hypothetical protein CXG45_19115 [Pseudomonas plecoglossicida]|uniref:Uncharacterized protein n=1 Tax=Pseudomonas plecoglossicida TaxID=70775 RepID=A0ABX4TZL4_PSEDL|nr:hypothetical protein CXG44_17185 [Pseudomonas plecoglossicida]PLU91484.1 hypothetical protein CXG45_19115 [Pseudomonas plecoglossicida]PLV00860.1 hypothetical protein CXG48_21170 [Pseudomonas plecoglossicida]PLV11273.1 hypothetical protein CXG47_21630 [Pseudomonas plecoglossicida]
MVLAQDLYWLCRPLRGHARSHRYCTGVENGATPVGAGAPAKGPVQAQCIGSEECILSQG